MNRIVEKIRKLLALAESSNENEAAVAASMAARLMLEHGIEQSQIPEAPVDDLAAEGAWFDENGRASWRWQVELAGHVAEAMGCESAFVKVAVFFFGRSSNAKAAKAVWKDLSARLKVIAASESSRRKRLGLYRGTNFTQNYLRGMVDRVGRRLSEETERAVAQIGAAAVDHRLALIEDGKAAMEKLTNKVKTAALPDATNGAAYRAGFRDGARVDLGMSPELGSVTPALPGR